MILPLAIAFAMVEGAKKNQCNALAVQNGMSAACAYLFVHRIYTYLLRLF
jgi:hypothetical protein